MENAQISSVFSLYRRCVVSGGILDRAEREVGIRTRRRIYSAAVVLWLMVWQRLERRATLAKAVRHLIQGPGRLLLPDCKRVREGRISAAPGGYCQGLHQLPKLVPEYVTRDLVEQLSREISQPWPGLDVPAFVLDGSSLQLPYTRKLARAYPPAPNQHGRSHWPLVRIVVAHEINSGMALYPQWGPMFGERAISEQGLATALLPQLPAGAVVVADRNFGVFSVVWEATRQQHPVIVRLTKARAYKLFGGPISRKQDVPVVWAASRLDRPQAEPWPAGASLSGRLIATGVGRGKAKQWLYLFTTLNLPPGEVVALYGERWCIETDLRSLKRTVQLHRISARSADGFEKELLAAMCAYNLVRAVMCLAARRAGIPARRLSFTQVLDVVTYSYADLLSARTRDEHHATFERVLDWAAECKLPQRRKARRYPRQIWGSGGRFPARKTK